MTFIFSHHPSRLFKDSVDIGFLSFAGVKSLVKLFSYAEKCKTTAITSSDPNNKLFLLSFGTNLISDTQLNVMEKLFALYL